MSLRFMEIKQPHGVVPDCCGELIEWDTPYARDDVRNHSELLSAPLDLELVWTHLSRLHPALDAISRFPSLRFHLLEWQLLWQVSG